MELSFVVIAQTSGYPELLHLADSPATNKGDMAGLQLRAGHQGIGLIFRASRPGCPCLPRRTVLFAQFPTVSGTSHRLFSQQSQKRPRFFSRLRIALRNSKIQWYQIPVGLGIGFLGLVQFYKVTAREKERQKELEEVSDAEPTKRAKKRPRIRPDGPW